MLVVSVVSVVLDVSVVSVVFVGCWFVVLVPAASVLFVVLCVGCGCVFMV